MTITDMTSKRGKAADDHDANRPVEPKAREPVKRQTPIIPGLIAIAKLPHCGPMAASLSDQPSLIATVFRGDENVPPS